MSRRDAAGRPPRRDGSTPEPATDDRVDADPVAAARALEERLEASLDELEQRVGETRDFLSRYRPPQRDKPR